VVVSGNQAGLDTGLPVVVSGNQVLNVPKAFEIVCLVKPTPTGNVNGDTLVVEFRWYRGKTLTVRRNADRSTKR
jgi:hypothetical protein